MSDFHCTQMGQRFFEHTMPRLVKELARLNDNLERMNRAKDVPVCDCTGEQLERGEHCGKKTCPNRPV